MNHIIQSHVAHNQHFHFVMFAGDSDLSRDLWRRHSHKIMKKLVQIPGYKFTVAVIYLIFVLAIRIHA